MRGGRRDGRDGRTEPVPDAGARALGESEDASPAIREVFGAGSCAGGVEPALGDEHVGVGAPDARKAVGGTRGDVDHLALRDGDLVQDVLAVRRADRPAQRDHVVGLDDFLGVGRRRE
jgi:hypothetical protein